MTSHDIWWREDSISQRLRFELAIFWFRLVKTICRVSDSIYSAYKAVPSVLVFIASCSCTTFCIIRNKIGKVVDIDLNNHIETKCSVFHSTV